MLDSSPLKPLLNAPLQLARALRRPAVAWLWLCAVAAGGSVLAWWWPANRLDWQPALVAHEPWRAFTAAWVHWSALHLGANLLGTAVVAALGWAARLPATAALAWLLAWPLGHLALLWQPALLHYGGLSGVLHAAVAVAALCLLMQRSGAGPAVAATEAIAGARHEAAHRVVGGAVLTGLLLKLLLEAPWGPPLREGDGWDIAVAPLAHATGAAAGAGCAWLLCRGRRRPRPSPPG